MAFIPWKICWYRILTFSWFLTVHPIIDRLLSQNALPAKFHRLVVRSRAALEHIADIHKLNPFKVKLKLNEMVCLNERDTMQLKGIKAIF